MFNKIILVGNLTRDIEMRFSQGGMAIAKQLLLQVESLSLILVSKKRKCVLWILHSLQEVQK